MNNFNKMNENITDNKITKNKDLLKPANFEEAIESTGFGLFNFILILITILCSTANIFSSTSISYILPIAECDLKLTLLNKGALNAVTYAGMITSAIVWGYLADTQGRKKILVIGCLADAISSACCSLSQNFQMLIVFKFIEGFAANGPCAVLFTYLTEFHNAKNRPRLSMILGIIQSFANLLLPMLAWLILPQDWDFIIRGGFKVHSWQIFLFICGLPSLLSGVIFIVLPESPKFLMSQGRNTEALFVFQQIYAVNRRQSRDSYPIRQLIEEVPSRDSIHIPSAIFTVEGKSSKLNKSQKTTSFKQSLRDGWLQMRPMFHKPLLSRYLHVYVMLFALLLGLNSIRLWLPQLFASISKYEALHTDPSDSTDLCTILEFSVNKTQDVQSYTSDCSAYKNISMDMYLNNIIVAVIGLLGYFCAMFIIRVLGPKRLANYSLLVAALFGIGLYWSTDSLATLIISALFVNISSIATTSLNGLILTLFPTTLRTSVASLSMMFGRLGSLSGNLLFPIFMEYGCLPPFLMVSSMTIFASILSCLLPKETEFT
uniref:Major facilitator superfamily (MFS) profile domain-containing protein n=1 Tax=Glossina pallidipes TaxID=7398 RepID=A0A1A9ZAD2_GLOPL